MARTKATSKQRRKRHDTPSRTDTPMYRGKQTRNGNSLALRFDRALFHSHPEFSGEVQARVIGPGRMLVVAYPKPRKKHAEDDPMLASFLSFLAGDMQRSPERITPLEAADMGATLVDGVNTSAAEELGDEELI
jgi:hypothetical protein